MFQFPPPHSSSSISLTPYSSSSSSSRDLSESSAGMRLLSTAAKIQPRVPNAAYRSATTAVRPREVADEKSLNHILNVIKTEKSSSTSSSSSVFTKPFQSESKKDRMQQDEDDEVSDSDDLDVDEDIKESQAAVTSSRNASKSSSAFYRALDMYKESNTGDGTRPMNLMELPKGASAAAPSYSTKPNRQKLKRPASAIRSSQNVFDQKRRTTSSRIEFEDLMPFYFKHVLRWRMPLLDGTGKPDYSKKTEELCVAAAEHHPELCCCVEDNRIWQVYGGLGIYNASQDAIAAYPCGICQDSQHYETFINAVHKEWKNSQDNFVHFQSMWAKKRRDMFDLINKSSYTRDKKSGQEPVEVTALRAEVQRAFFIYNLLMWQFGDVYRTEMKKRLQQMDQGDTPAVDETFEKMRKHFNYFVNDYREFREKRDRGGPYMYCSEHNSIGDAVPWMRVADYKSCLICANEERKQKFRERKEASKAAIHGGAGGASSRHSQLTAELDALFEETEMELHPKTKELI